MVYLSSFTISFALTLWLSRFIINYLDPTIFLDYPSKRKLHNQPIPRYGGIAFGLVVLVIGGFLLGNIHIYSWYLLGAAGLFLLGAMDDYWSLSWKMKLPIQLSIGLFISFQFIGKIEMISFFNQGISLPVLGLIILFLLWFIGIVNSVNLIDGMDGLAGGYMLLTSFFAVILGWISDSPDFVLINSIIIGAMVAFLHYNQSPAKFFMGDAGSLLLGYHLAVMPLFYAQSTGLSGSVNITPFIILFSYLIVDTTRVFYIRLREKRNPLMPDNTHLHHIMYKSSGSYNGTLLMIFILVAVAGIATVLQGYFSFGRPAMIIYLSFLFVFIIFPSVTGFAVKLLSDIIHIINKKRDPLFNQAYLIRVRYIPVLIFIYFSGLLSTNWDSFLQRGTPFLSFGLGVLFLYILFSPRSSVIAEVIIVGIGIFQGILLIYPTSDSAKDFFLLAGIMKYSSLTFLSIITLTNIIIHTRNLTAEFWSVIDFLVIFVLVALASLQSLGFGVSPLVCFELGIIYFSNKLYAPRLFPLPDLAGEPAG